MLLNKEDLLKKQVLRVEKVTFKNGDFVYVREMTGHDRDTYESSLLQEVRLPNGQTDYQRNLDDFRAKLAVMTVCDEKGKLIFEYKDYKKLAENIPAKMLSMIVDKANELNGIDAEKVEQAVKN